MIIFILEGIKKQHHDTLMKNLLIIVFAGASLLLGLAGCENKTGENAKTLSPIDLQKVQDQDDMTWTDYKPIPGIKWADSTLKTGRGFRIALIAVDFSDQPFVITLPKNSDLFGNPQIDPIKREEVAMFYADFFIKPSEVNHGQTINGYWMEQSRGKFGITTIDAFGPYLMPKKLWEYGLNEWGQNYATPDGSQPTGWMEDDADSLWNAAEGDLKGNYDAVLRIYAGYDETGVWQEFGEMKFLSKEDIPAEWGNPDTEKPRWVKTRYVPWTSWKTGQMQWGISSMRQGENSGTITHELGHFAFNIGDNNNNPYIQPYRRAGSGPWDMMDRGCFNGPGGPHKRWLVPAIGGGSMPAGLMLRNRIVNGFENEGDVLVISREDLLKYGTAVVRITARAVSPKKGEYSGLIVRLDGAKPYDYTPYEDPLINPLSQGTSEFNFYSMEVIQRVGYDSFCPDNGVLLAKNKDQESLNGEPNAFNCFNWVIDAHPEDINMVDYVRPDGSNVMRTIADYRQLNDALFHAGLNSGSKYEYIDAYNNLHFYIVDLQSDSTGIISYTVGVKAIQRSIKRHRSVQLSEPESVQTSASGKFVCFTISNFDDKLKENPAGYYNSDIYRLTVNAEGQGWHAEVLNNLVAVNNRGESVIPVYFRYDRGADKNATINLTVQSVSSASLVATASYKVER